MHYTNAGRDRYALDTVEKRLTDLIDISEIPTLPEMARMAISKTLSMDKSADEIASIIKENPSLTLKILKIANSPMYTSGVRISNIKEAVILLGYKTIKSLILSITVRDIFTEDENEWFDYRAFWLHAIATAVISEAITRETVSHAAVTGMNAYTAGLLHDIGKVILLLSDDIQYSRVVDLVKESKVPFSEAEEQVLGFDHSDVSAFLFEYWELSDSLIKPVRDHHRDAEYLTRQNDPISAIVAIANQISHISGFNTHRDEPPYEVGKDVIGMLGLDQAAMDRILTDSREYLETLADALSIPKADIKGYFELLSSANHELGAMYLENHRKSEEINRKSSLCVELNTISRCCLHERDLVSAARQSLRSLMSYFQFDYAWFELYLNREKSVLCSSRRPKLFGESIEGELESGLEERESIVQRGSAVIDDEAELFSIKANDEEEIGRIAVTCPESDKNELKAFIDHLALGLSNVRLHFKNRVKTENLNIAVKHLKEEHGKRQNLSKLNDLILDTTPVGILSISRSGSLIQYNREAELILMEPLKGKNFFKLNLFAGDDMKARLSNMENERQTRDIALFHSGNQYHFLIESVPIEGTPHILILIRDMSERIEEAKILIQKEKMATLGELAAGIAHNLRSPLAVVKGIPELILSDMETGGVRITRKVSGKQVKDREIEDNLRLISKSMEKALAIIDSIMDFTKKEPGQYETVVLSDIINEVFALFEHRLKDREIRFKNGAGTGTLYADRNMITQIFINLFNNSINAVDKKGTIEVQYRQEKGKTIIKFLDDGVGVDRENLDQIFEPFFTTTGTADGTGIGLSITRKMVTLHGGSIKAMPRSGGGTIIEIIFPEKGKA